MTTAPPAHVVGIELLPLIDQHTQEDTFAFILLTHRLGGDVTWKKNMLISQCDNSYFSLKWFHILEGVECSKPIKNHVIL